MSYFEFPHTRTYDSDLGWLIKQVKYLTDQVNIKTINYSDPIFWDITRQYPKYTVVVDPYNNIAYLSKQPVPINIAITDTDYWVPVFDFTELYAYAISLRQQLAIGYETTYQASVAYSVGELVFIADHDLDLLYQITAVVNIGDTLDPLVNIHKVTFEELIGNLLTLNTSNKTSLVDAINEIFTIADAASNDLGDITTLTTSDTSSAVAAINEVNAGMVANDAILKRKKNILIIGDSYSRAGYVPAGKEWFSLLQSRDGYNIYNYSLGGSGFVMHQSGSQYISDEIDSAYAGISDPESIGYVILFAGYNDYSLNATLYDEYDAVIADIASIKTKFPKAEILFVPFNQPYNAAVNYKHMEFLTTMVTAGQDSEVLTYEYTPFLFAHKEYGACVSSNHPNELGNEIIYDLMHKMLNGNNKPNKYLFKYHPSTYGGVTVLNDCHGYFALEGYTYESHVRLQIAPGTYANAYQIAQLEDIDTGNNIKIEIPTAERINWTYDNAGYDFATQTALHPVTFLLNSNATIRADFPSGGVTGSGAANGFYKIQGKLIDRAY